MMAGRYIVGATAIRHGGRRHSPGEAIGLTEAVAADLLAKGLVVEDAGEVAVEAGAGAGDGAGPVPLIPVPPQPDPQPAPSQPVPPLPPPAAAKGKGKGGKAAPSEAIR